MNRILTRLMRFAHILPSYTAMFVPCGKLGNRDLVAPFLGFSQRRLPPEYTLLVCERFIPHISNLCRSVGISVPKRAILFAHSTHDQPGFLVNPDPSTGEELLLLRFWEGRSHRFDILVAHVCHGAGVLRRPLWRKTFPKWVSYERDLPAFLATERANTRWSNVVHALLTAVPRSRRPRAVAARMRAVYEEAIAELYDTYDDRSGDALNLMYLQNHLQSVVSSED
jgi:hypothetical protein